MQSVRCIILSLLLLSFTPSLLYSDDTYTPSNIQGGWVRRVVEAPSSPGTFYAASFGIYKTTNGGQTWTRLSLPTPPAEATEFGPVWGKHDVNSIAVNPSDANNIVVADSAWSPLWTSTDGGETWIVTSFDSNKWENYKRSAIVASSLYNHNYFFASLEKQVWEDNTTPATLYMSKDKGLTWSALNLSTTNNESFVDVLHMPSSGRIVVTVVDVFMPFPRDNADCPCTGKIYYSDDEGATFTQTSFTEPAYKMTWDATNEKIWLITSRGKVYASSDGINWGTEILYISETVTAYHRPVGIFYSNSTIPCIYAFSNETAYLYRSTDSAHGFPSNSWKKLTLPEHNTEEKEVFIGRIEDIVVDSRYLDGSHWGLASSDGGFYYTINTTSSTIVNEITQQTGICTTYIRFGTKDEATNRIYVHSDSGIHYSPDNGSTWSCVYPQKGKAKDTCSFISFDPSNTSKVYLMSNLKILYTENNGSDYFNNILYDFQPLGYINWDQYLSNMLIHPTTNVMFVGIVNRESASLGNYLYKSIDNGITWSQVTTLTSHGIYYLVTDPSDPSIMYAACGDKLSDSIFSGTADGLYRSEDTGVTWTLIGFEDEMISRIGVHETNSDILLVGYKNTAGSSGTSVSMDYGSTWKDLESQAEATEANSTPQKMSLGTDISFIIGDDIYSGNAEGFIYRNANFGVTPSDLVAILPKEVTYIFKGSLYAATGAGLYALNLENISSVKPYTGSQLKAYNFPNPFNPKTDGQTVIRISFPNTIGTLKLKIYSLSGDLVAEESFDNVTGAYAYAFIWDGKNQKGDLCAPGLYFLVGDADGTRVRHKIVMVR